MDELCKTRLKDNWTHETSDPQTQAWREELTVEEHTYVSGLDRDYNKGILAICSAILVREKVRTRYRPEEILELETVYDHCRLRLRDGRTLLARLGRGNSLQLTEVQAVS